MGLKVMKSISRLPVIVFLLICVVSVNGQNPTDFKLNSATDNSQFRLSDAKGKFVALHFLLKTECPVCIRHTQDYFSKAETLPDVVQVFLKPDSEEEIEVWSKNLTKEEFIEFPIYRDPDAKLANQFNIPDGYEFHNQVVHYPALILLDPNGKEVFRYIGKVNRDRYSFEQLELKIAELKK
jgi:peroxiredoxin Q/BCP